MPASHVRSHRKSAVVNNVQLFLLGVALLLQTSNDHFWRYDIALMCLILTIGIYVGYRLTGAEEQDTTILRESQPNVFETVLFWVSLVAAVLFGLRTAIHPLF